MIITNLIHSRPRIIGIAIMDYSNDVLYNKHFVSFDELHPEEREFFEQSIIDKLE